MADPGTVDLTAVLHAWPACAAINTLHRTAVCAGCGHTTRCSDERDNGYGWVCDPCWNGEPRTTVRDPRPPVSRPCPTCGCRRYRTDPPCNHQPPF